MTDDEPVSGEQPAALLVPTITPARFVEHVEAIAASGRVALMNSEYARALRGERERTRAFAGYRRPRCRARGISRRAMAGDSAER
jgi:hypothetical protein